MEASFERRLMETLTGTPPATPTHCDPATPRTPSSVGRTHSPSPCSTPLSSTRHKSAYYDRCIPSRVGSPRRCLFGSPISPLPDLSSNRREQSTEPPKVENLTYQCALQNELLNRHLTEIPDPHSVSRGSPLTIISPSKSNVLKVRLFSSVLLHPTHRNSN
ncbi:hypothetical protein GBAR_LOCUS1342 [Geodia barretti]|uniref:Uncharacterized protein n=1 Tax=Geodia barretti TaxID=519541 RepID=A0AA35VV82_GEOBA|nr:hypothetical protein GBAR_LOCUS1342 [Geodia barretti]